MSLEYTIDSSKYDKLDESLQALYKKEGDGYKLDATGVVAKTEHDKFRKNNINLINANEGLQKQVDGFDQDGYNEYLANKQKAKDGKLIDEGKIDELVASKVEVVVNDYQAKLDTANETIAALQSDKSGIINKYEIQNATATALAANKINPTFHSPLTAQINSMFTVKEGNVVAMDGDKIMTGANGNLTISEFVESQDDAFKIRSSGGNGTGGGGGGGTPQTLKRADFDAKSPSERMDFIQGGGKTVD